MLMLFSQALWKWFTSKVGGGVSGILGSKFLKILSIRVTSKCSLGFNVATAPMVLSTLVFCFSSFGSWSLNLFSSLSDDTSGGGMSLSDLVCIPHQCQLVKQVGLRTSHGWVQHSSLY